MRWGKVGGDVGNGREINCGSVKEGVTVGKVLQMDYEPLRK